MGNKPSAEPEFNSLAPSRKSSESITNSTSKWSLVNSFKSKKRSSKSTKRQSKSVPLEKALDEQSTWAPSFEQENPIISIPFFDELGPKNLQMLSTLFDRITVPADTVIASEDNPVDYFYVIVSGRVRVTTHMDDGEEVHLHDLGMSSFFGETALFKDNIQAVTVRTIEPTIIMSITRETFNKFVETCPENAISIKASFAESPVTTRLKTIPYFADIDERKMRQLACLFQFRRCPSKTLIFRQGAYGEGFYLIVKGRVEVIGTKPDGKNIPLATLKDHDYFGEVALTAKTARTASVRCLTDCVLLFLSTSRFENFVKAAPEVTQGAFATLVTQRRANTFKTVPFFSCLKTKQVGSLHRYDENRLMQLGELFVFAQFGANETVYSENDPGDALYIVVHGQAEEMGTKPDGEPITLRHIRAGDWFGDLSLLRPGPRTSTVITTKEPLLLLKLFSENFQHFLDLVPEVRPRIEHMIGIRTAQRLENIPFFTGINENKPYRKLDILGSLFMFEEFEQGQTVFTQGSVGDKFFLIVSGEVCVQLTSEDGATLELSTLKVGEWFGEIALLMKTPRTASVKCISSCVFCSITSAKFQKFLAIAPELGSSFGYLVSHRTANTLKEIKFFKQVKENKPWSKLELLGTLFDYECVDSGVQIFDIGDTGDKFYLILFGEVRATLPDPQQNSVLLSEGDYFGEVALLKQCTRTAKLVTSKQCILLTLTKEKFEKFLRMAPEVLPSIQQRIADDYEHVDHQLESKE